jgi:uncharacterized protein (TIGR00369 family)
MSEAICGHERILQQTIDAFRALPIPEGVHLELPPNCAKEIETRYVEYVPNKSLKATFTVPNKYANAVGVMQGGFLAAIFDNLMGPLGYLTARKPTTSLELITHFFRPILPGEELTVTATVRKSGRTVLYVSADAVNQEDKLVSTASSMLQVLSF